MIPNRPITFIHLSDIHFRKGTSATGYDLDESIRNEVGRDIKRLKDELQFFDGILVTGDIAFAGKAEEYEIAQKWLLEISQLIECVPEAVWVVPGNHDVDRSIEADAVIQIVRQKLRDTPEDKIDDEFKKLVHDQLQGGEFVFKPLGAYCEFAAKYECKPTPQHPHWEKDFLLNDGSVLRIIGLNSAILSCAQDDDGGNRLVLNQHQLVALRRQDGVEYVTLCHHPIDWLKNRDSIGRSLKAKTRAQLFGHKHEHACETINNSTVSLVAGAAHPERDGKTWLPRYNVISFFVETNGKERKLIVKIYPRVWHATGENFIADQGHCDNGSNFKSVIFVLDSWEAPAVPEIADNSDGGTEPAAEGETETEQSSSILDIRKLTYDFLTLPYPDQMRVANELELLEEADSGLEKSELFKRIVARARDKNLLQLFSDKVKRLQEKS